MERLRWRGRGTPPPTRAADAASIDATASGAAASFGGAASAERSPQRFGTRRLSGTAKVTVVVESAESRGGDGDSPANAVRQHGYISRSSRFEDWWGVLTAPRNLATLVYAMSYTVSLPVLPFMARKQLYGEGAHPAVPEAWRGLAYGLVMSGYYATKMVSAPLIGFMSDRWGRRQALMVTFAGCSVTFFLTMAIGQHSIIGLIMCRLLMGCFAANGALMHAYVRDTVPSEWQASAFAQHSAAWGLAYAAASPILGYLKEEATPCLAFASVCMCVATVVVWLQFEETHRNGVRRPRHRRAGSGGAVDAVMDASGDMAAAAVPAVAAAVPVVAAAAQQPGLAAPAVATATGDAAVVPTVLVEFDGVAAAAGGSSSFIAPKPSPPATAEATLAHDFSFPPRALPLGSLPLAGLPFKGRRRGRGSSGGGGSSDGGLRNPAEDDDDGHPVDDDGAVAPPLLDGFSSDGSAAGKLGSESDEGTEGPTPDYEMWPKGSHATSVWEAQALSPMGVDALPVGHRVCDYGGSPERQPHHHRPRLMSSGRRAVPGAVAGATVHWNEPMELFSGGGGAEEQRRGAAAAHSPAAVAAMDEEDTTAEASEVASDAASEASEEEAMEQAAAAQSARGRARAGTESWALLLEVFWAMLSERLIAMAFLLQVVRPAQDMAPLLESRFGKGAGTVAGLSSVRALCRVVVPMTPVIPTLSRFLGGGSGTADDGAGGGGLAKAVADRRVAAFMCIIMATLAALLPSTASLPMLHLLAGLKGLCYVIRESTVNAAMARVASSANVGAFFGWQHFMKGMAGVSSNMVAGWLSNHSLESHYYFTSLVDLVYAVTYMYA